METKFSIKTEVALNGVTKTVEEWCVELKIDVPIVRQRVLRWGWSIDRALTAQIRKRRPQQIEYGGSLRPLTELAREYGLLPETVYFRINKLGWDAEKALTTSVSEPMTTPNCEIVIRHPDSLMIYAKDLQSRKLAAKASRKQMKAANADFVIRVRHSLRLGCDPPKYHVILSETMEMPKEKKEKSEISEYSPFRRYRQYEPPRADAA
jgi:hypothetical protein